MEVGRPARGSPHESRELRQKTKVEMRGGGLRGTSWRAWGKEGSEMIPDRLGVAPFSEMEEVVIKQRSPTVVVWGS